MAITFGSGAVVGGALKFVKVSMTDDTFTAATVFDNDGKPDAKTVARNAMAALIANKVQPMIFGEGYTDGSGSAVLFVVPATATLAADETKRIASLGDQVKAISGLSGATVVITDTLKG